MQRQGEMLKHGSHLHWFMLFDRRNNVIVDILGCGDVVDGCQLAVLQQSLHERWNPLSLTGIMTWNTCLTATTIAQY